MSEVGLGGMKYKAVIFDWDGTLADSTDRIVESMQGASAESGLEQRSSFEIKQIIGLSLSEAIVTLWPELERNHRVVQSMCDDYGRHYRADHHPVTQFYPHADHLLQRIRMAGSKIAVATGKNRLGLDRAMQEMGVAHHFDESRCADETRSKPHPLMLEELASVLNLPITDMLMVGDTHFDLNMAKAAGMDSVGLTHGAHGEEKLVQCEPLAIFHDLKTLSTWLES